MPRKNVNWRRLQDSTMEQAVRVLNPPRLLIADDDDDLREMLAGVLRLDGYQVVEARNGSELLHHIATSAVEDGTAEPFDLIITDVRMPGWSGLQVLSGVRRTDWAIPVVMITAYGDHDTEEEALRLGAAAFFRKPFELDALREAVANILPYQPAERQARTASAAKAARTRSKPQAYR